MPVETTNFTCRLLDAEETLQYGATLAGENRSTFIREAIRERTRRLERNVETPTEEESDHAEE